MPPAVVCNNVSIRYKTGDLKAIGLKEYIMRRLTGNYHVRDFWADRDISFSLEKGDMLGIVGTNGAGKSTLLKAITGIMVPTNGSVRTYGNIAALLELASGFDGDLTVRENTYLRGALLGYTKQFMDSQYQEIIRFAELEEFQDYMFKQLSSGMKSRLAFSIACLVDPDILILDEVLSVGDGAFKEKSAKRMKEILQNGVTGILVSHSVKQVEDLCNKCLWLDHGNQVAFSDAYTVCNAYRIFLVTPPEKRTLPKSMEELHQMSDRYRVAAWLGELEKTNTDLIKQEWYRNQTDSQRILRWLDQEAQLEAEERNRLLEELDELRGMYE